VWGFFVDLEVGVFCMNRHTLYRIHRLDQRAADLRDNFTLEKAQKLQVLVNIHKDIVKREETRTHLNSEKEF
jgi:hypothetical protein